MVKTRGGFDRGMAFSHTPPTRCRSSKSSTPRQEQGDIVDLDVPFAPMPLNVMVPPELQLSSEDSSSSEDLLDFVENPEQVATEKIEIEEESTQ